MYEHATYILFSNEKELDSKNFRSHLRNRKLEIDLKILYFQCQFPYKSDFACIQIKQYCLDLLKPFQQFHFNGNLNFGKTKIYFEIVKFKCASSKIFELIS